MFISIIVKHILLDEMQGKRKKNILHRPCVYIFFYIKSRIIKDKAHHFSDIILNELRHVKIIHRRTGKLKACLKQIYNECGNTTINKSLTLQLLNQSLI